MPRGPTADLTHQLIQSGTTGTRAFGGALNPIHWTDIVGGTPIWDMEIRGDREIVSIASAAFDTHDVCELADAAIENDEPGGGHRKILSNVWFADGGEINGTTHQEGTRAAVIVAGEPGDGETAEVGTSGVAPAARLVLSKLGEFENAIAYPSSLDHLEFDYSRGARIFLLDVAAPDLAHFANYDLLAAEADEFMRERRDALVVVPFASGSVSYNARGIERCKSCLVVGSSRNFDPEAVTNTRDTVGLFGGRRDGGMIGTGYVDNNNGYNHLIPDDTVTKSYSSNSLYGWQHTTPSIVMPAVRLAIGDNTDSGCSWAGRTPPSNADATGANDGASRPFPRYGAAYAAGAAALVRQYLREGLHTPERTPYPSPSGALIKALLIASTQPLLTRDAPYGNYWQTTWGWKAHHFSGSGRPALSRVLRDSDAALPPSKYVYFRERVGMGDGAVDIYRVRIDHARVPSNRQARVACTVVWTDAAGEVGTVATTPTANLSLSALFDRSHPFRGTNGSPRTHTSIPFNAH